jgi:hypothetical protein
MKDKERWRELCEQASKEQDGKKLLELTQEIYRLLQERTSAFAKNPRTRTLDGAFYFGAY